MKQHITRAYNSFYVDSSGGTITKQSKEPRLRDEIVYYEAMRNTPHTIFFPRFLGSRFEDGMYKMELEYYAYKNLGDYMVYEPFNRDFWEKVARSLQTVLGRFAETRQKGDFSSYARAMYIDKTEKYYLDLLKNSKFKAMSENGTLKINGEQYLNFGEIWDDVKVKIEKELANLQQMSVIHGDMCFSNILCGINSKTDTCILKFVDPRGHFGASGIFGDPLYDYAKLIHSYEGKYEYIIYDQFALEENESLTEFHIAYPNANHHRIKEIFGDFGPPSARLIEGLIYIGMCSRHYDSEKRQTVMYTNGVRLLNEALSE
jgi:hypothetical protein